MNALPRTLRVIVFPGVQNLPGFAAEDRGFYARRGLAVETTFTRSSEQQRNGLAQGEYDFAHAAVDNAIAMVDAADHDVVIVVGLDGGFNKLIVQPGIASYDDLRGKTLGVDAPDTAFALVAYEMLKRKGIQPGEYRVQAVGATRFRLEALKDKEIDFSLLNLPFNLFAREAGLAVLDDPRRVIGAYQSMGGFAKRDWAEQNRETLVEYLAAYVEGLRWTMDSDNRNAAIALLAARMQLAPHIAEQCYAQITHPKTGFANDAMLDRAGMAKVLELRASFTGTPIADIPAPGRYIDERYRRGALEALQSHGSAQSTA